MNHFSKKLIYLVALVSTVYTCGANTISMLVPRSQSFNANRQMVGWNNPDWGINRKPQDENYHAFNLTFAYTRTFRGDRLARCFFGDDLVCGCDDKAVLGVSSTGADNVEGSLYSAETFLATKITSLRGPRDWLGDYFGLPADYKGTVCFDPRISNFILDFSYYAGLDAWVEGMYFRIHAPFVHTKWSLGATETTGTAGNGLEFLRSETAQGPWIPFTGQYPPGYYAKNGVKSTDDLNKGFLDYANGCTPTIEGITWQPLCCSRINNDCNCDELIENGFGEIRFVLGRNVINDEDGDYHLGAGIYVAAPTGTRPGDNCKNGRYLFQPIVGNGKHWELGAQVTAHHICWRSEDEDKSFGWYLTANVTHLFNACQTRCFDLCSAGSNSRYMLAYRLQDNRGSNPRLREDTAPRGLEFANEFAPVANLTRRQVETNIGVQGDVAFSFAYQSGGFQWDIGYDFWGRSCENICVKKDCCPAPGLWALKGINEVYGLEDGNPSKPVALAATDSKATIYGPGIDPGTTFGAETFLKESLNFYADDAVDARTNNHGYVTSQFISADLSLYTSKRPILIKEDDLDLTGTRGISHKLFTSLNYAWTNREGSDWTPWVNVGAEAEFGKTEGSCKIDCNSGCPTMKKCCTDCAISQWGVWFKVGASYN